MNRDHYEEIMHHTPDECEDCGGMPDHWDPKWIYCPYHGAKLRSAAELEEQEQDAQADARRDSLDLAGHVWELGCDLNRIGVVRW